ncbi:MAG TPA: alpha/beta fold hydrolase [Bryobacteraceae bacterium]
MSSIRSDISAPGWIEFCTRVPRPQFRLFCFHHAGGSALIFRDWHKYIPQTIEVCPIQLPGRGRRRAETPSTNLAELSAALARGIEHLLDLPFAFFGYSMGATVAFETARRLEARRLRPLALVVAAARPPSQQRAKTEYWKLPRERLIERLRTLQSTPEEILNNSELMDYFLAIVRADFQVLETNRMEPGAKTACPILAMAGASDSDVQPEEMRGWSELTTGPFSFETLAGGHSFVIRQPAEVIARVRMSLAR